VPAAQAAAFASSVASAVEIGWVETRGTHAIRVA
jgi:hypothetical protein